MNCKQGQLVRYTGQNHFNRPNVYGWVGRTVRLDCTPDAVGNTDPSWIVEPPLPGGRSYLPLNDGTVLYSDGDWVPDCALRPIRDPGEDAVDEMVLKIGKTSHEEVVA